MIACFAHPNGNLLRYRWSSHTIWIDIYYDFNSNYEHENEFFASDENSVYPWIYNVPDFGKLADITVGAEDEWADDSGWNIYTYRYDPDRLGIPLEKVISWRKLYDMALAAFGWEQFDEWAEDGELYGITGWFASPDSGYLRYRWFDHTICIDIYYGVG